jgi:Family of unknown function (DUF6114)
MTADDAGSAREADADSSSVPTEPAPPELKPRVTSHRRRSLTSHRRRPLTSHRGRSLTPHRGRSLRAAFRAWRRSRPFWGGLLLVLGGLELLGLPLTGVFVRGAIKLVIYIGIGGVFGVLIGVLLIAAGIVLWVNPTHRVFYGIAGIVLGIVSFPASNLGGFLLGMLLAIIGGALAFAWVPADPEPVAAAPASRATDAPEERDSGGKEPFAGLHLISGTRVERERTAREGSVPNGSVPDDSVPNGTVPNGTVPEEPAPASDGSGLRVGDAAGHRMLAVAALPAVLVAGLLGTGGAAKAAPSPDNGGNCILGILCLPTPTPSAIPTPTPSPTTPSATPSATPSSLPSTSPGPSASPSASPSGAASPSPTSSASASASPSASPKSTSSKSARSKGSKVARKRAAAPSDLIASGAVSVLSAGSATLADFKYQGIVSLPVSGGGSERMLEFTASSADLSGDVTVSVTQGGLTTDTSSPTLGFSDGLTLYATQLCGNIYGLIPKCFTPSTSSAILLELANLLTGIAPITMTDVTTDQPLATAGALQTGSLVIGF